MEDVLKNINLGKRLNVGETFITVTKKMAKNRHAQCKWNKEMTGNFITYEVLRQNDIRVFEKGKRKYVCRVVSMVEMRTGYYNWLDYTDDNKSREYIEIGKRWWQFFYLVRIMEN